MRETIEGREYELVTPNVCAGCHFFSGEDIGCNLPDDAEIGCGPNDIYVEVKESEK